MITSRDPRLRGASMGDEIAQAKEMKTPRPTGAGRGVSFSRWHGTCNGTADHTYIMPTTPH